MNNHEFELKKLVVRSGNFSKFLGLVQRICTLMAFVGSVYLIMRGLVDISGQNPASINALASVVDKLKISGILGYVVAAGASTGWYIERRGKRRAYTKLGDNRAHKERGDPYHPSSELDANGQTPN